MTSKIIELDLIYTMKKLLILFILLNLLLLNISNASTSGDRNAAKKALASIEAYNTWATIEMKKQSDLQMDKDNGKLEKIMKIQTKTKETLAQLNNLKRRSRVIAKGMKVLLSLSPTDIIDAQTENNKILEKVKWDENDGENIILKDLEKKEKIVKEWDWNYKDLIDLVKAMSFEWAEKRKKNLNQIN